MAGDETAAPGAGRLVTRGYRGVAELPPGPARDLADLLRRLRQQHALSVGQIAARAGVSRSHVSEVLRGWKSPSPDIAAVLARVLGAGESDVSKARQWAGQVRELRYYQRTHPPPASHPQTSPAPRPRRRQASASRSDIAGAVGPGDSGQQRPAPHRGREFGMTVAGGRPTLEVCPVAIGHYTDPGLADLDAERRAGRLVDLLAPFGGWHRTWPHPVRERGADAVQRRLRDWSRPVPQANNTGGRDDGTACEPAGTVLYWVGHGWSDGTRAALAHAHSPAAVGESGLEPLQLAQAIRDRQARGAADETGGAAGGWVLVVIDTDHAAAIADAIMAALHGPDAPGRLLLVAVPRDGAAGGGFPDVLTGLLADTFRAERRIALRDLAGQLERVLGSGNVYQRGLGEAALVRVFPPAASWMSAPVETIGHLEDVLAGLSPDERSHFVAKAQAAEHGEHSELPWFFEGRQDETAQICAWLHRPGCGMLVVTGRAGSGKSALLGHVLVLSLPVLRDALARRGLITLPPAVTLPPDDVFDVVIHLSGLTLTQATRRAASAAGLGRLPSETDPALGVANDLDWLARQLPTLLTGRERPLTILADALDEATDPLDTARSLLARLAALPHVRVLAGTRASTHETPDTPVGDRNLLAALGAGLDSCGSDSPAVPDILQVGRDPAAIARYVAGRLRHARDHGTAGQAVPGMAQVRDTDIDRAAAAVAARDRQFLYARLVACELIADPTLLRPGRDVSLAHLLGGDHQDVFATALDRLGRLDDHYVPLIQALALARGRGMPEADGIWATAAASLTPPGNPDNCVTPRTQAVAQAIHGLLGHAAAYIAVGTAASAGRRSTVYRLAHRTFAEHFTRTIEDSAAHQDRQCLAAMALLDKARQVAAADPADMPAYLARHLSGHVADAGLWDDLAAASRVLDGLDPAMVTADALRTLFGRQSIPPPIAGVIGARDELLTATAMDRAGLRQLASTTHSTRRIAGEPCHGWGIAAAQAGQASMHIRLAGHTAIVNSVCAVPLPDGRIAVASASNDGTIRLWDVHTAAPIGVPLTGHTGTVEGICAVPLPGLKVLLASAGSDGTVRVWDPVTGHPVGPPMTGHAGVVYRVCAVPGADGAGQRDGRAWIASAGSDGAIRIWDPVTGHPAGPPMTGHTGAVGGVCAVPAADREGHRDGRTWLASAGDDGTVRVWDPVTGREVGSPMTGHAGVVYGVCAVPGADGAGLPEGRAWLASAGGDGAIRVWDPVTGHPVGPPLTGHMGVVFGVCAVPAADGVGHRAWLASAGADGTVRVWNPVTGHPVGPPMTGHTGVATGVCAVPGADGAGLPEGRAWLASAGGDGAIRVWDLVTGHEADPPLTGHTGVATGVCAVPGVDRAGQRDGRTWIASAGGDGAVRVWDPVTGHPVGPPMTGHTSRVGGVCAVPGADGAGHLDGRTWIASAGDDGAVRVWDPVTGHPVGPPMTGHTGAAFGVCVVPGADAAGQRDGRIWLASAGFDGTVRVWDLVTGHPVGPPMTGHTGAVLAVCTVPAADREGHRDGRTWLASAGDDGAIRVWDPVTGHPVGPPMTGHTGTAYGVCAVPGADAAGQRDGRIWLASAGYDGMIRIWDPVTGHPVGPPMIGHTGIVTGVCAVPAADREGHRDGRTWLASAGDDGAIRVWDPVTGHPVGPPMIGHTGVVIGVCAVPAADGAGHRDGRTWLASAGADGTVRVWDLVTGHPVGQPMSASLPPVAALQPLQGPDAGCAVVHCAGRLHRWDPVTATLTPMTAHPCHVSAFTELTMTSPTSRPVIADTTGQVSLLTPGQHAPSRTTCLGSDILYLLSVPGQPGQLACASREGTIALLDAITLHQAGSPLTGHTGPVRALCLLPGEAGTVILASAGNDATIRLWDPARETALGKPLTGHTGWIWSLTAIPVPGQRTSLLASASADATIRLWDPRTGQAVMSPLEGHTGQVRAVICATASNGSTLLVSGSHDGTVRLWHPTTGQFIYTIPLGIPIHALLQQPPDKHSHTRTHGGATITVGLRTGILSLDLSQSAFPAK